MTRKKKTVKPSGERGSKCSGKCCKDNVGTDREICQAAELAAKQTSGYALSALKAAEVLKFLMQRMRASEEAMNRLYGILGFRATVTSPSDIGDRVRSILSDDPEDSGPQSRGVPDSAVENFVKLLSEASSRDISGARFSIGRVPQLDTERSVCVEFCFRRDEQFGPFGRSVTKESFRTNVYPGDKERSVAEFDAHLGAMVWFDFPLKAREERTEPDRRDGGEATAPKAEDKPVRVARVKSVRPSDSVVKKGLLAGSSYLIPQGRLVVRFLRTDKRHGNHVYGLSFHPKSVRSYRPGERQSPENAVLNIRVKGDTGSRIYARFDKAVDGLKTMRFPRKK